MDTTWIAAGERVVFEAGWVLPWAALVILLLLWMRHQGLFKAGVPGRRRAVLLTLRGLMLVVLALLLARPTAVETEDPGARRRVALLLDRSASMGLEEAGVRRFDVARETVERALIPAFEAVGWSVDPHLFADTVHPAPTAVQRQGIADGQGTDFGLAIAQVVEASERPPLAVVVLSDGVATASDHNRAALGALVDTGTPLVGLGIGAEAGAASLSLRSLSAPTTVPPQRDFRIHARLEATGEGELPAFDVLLLREGRVVDRRTVEPGRGSRLWTESFTWREDEPGLVELSVELQMAPELVSARRRASTPVRITDEQSSRVLFAQGALSWNYKFVGRALRSDPSLRLTGLSRTSERSVFRQNVETASELVEGFPDDVSELAPFRVVVLSELGPGDLEPRQQEAVARFVGEMGGGLLMIGGHRTFNASWVGSRLEALLPVTFEQDPGLLGLDRTFDLELSERALGHPVFRLSDDPADDPWSTLPGFVHYGRVRAAKPGATVWARHSHDDGLEGRRILMASQRYGAGLSAIIGLQNLWRWRLAKDSDPAHFDRFVRQLMRFLAEGGAQEFTIEFPDAEPMPGRTLRALVERRPAPSDGAQDPADEGPFLIRIADPEQQTVREQEVDLAPGRPVEVEFQATSEGLWTVSVVDAQGIVRQTQSIEIRQIDVEMERTGRDLENLRQWAGLSGGLALPLDGPVDTEALITAIKQRSEALRKERERRRPLGLDGWVLAFLLACLGGEWLLRKRWDLR